MANRQGGETAAYSPVGSFQVLRAPEYALTDVNWPKYPLEMTAAVVSEKMEIGGDSWFPQEK
jgi:hypothetical protein